MAHTDRDTNRLLSGSFGGVLQGSVQSVLSGSTVVPAGVYRTTPARWYILFTFCYSGLVQGFIGNSWGPITTVMENVYSWDAARMTRLSLWTPVFFVPGAVVFPLLMSLGSMRGVMLGNTALMALAGGIKVLSVTVIPFHYLIYTAHVTQIINGFCGATCFSAIMYISVNWFPVKEQLIAAGVIISCLNMGLAVPFITGPAIVPDNTALYHDKHFYDTRLRYYLVLQGACMVLSLILTVLYFPSRPQYAPTATAVTQRLNIREGMAILLRRPNFWLPVLIFSFTTGTFNGYGLTLDTILKVSNISQSTAGFLGGAALMSTVPANLVIGALGGLFPKYKKLMTIVFLTIGTLSITVAVAQFEGWMARYMAVIWVSIVVGAMCITGCAPLLFDMSTESSYPVSEELSSTIMVLCSQTMCLIFIVVMQIPNLVPEAHADKLNFVLIASFSVAVLSSLLYHSTHVMEDIARERAVTVDQLDHRSFQQIENAGYSIER